MLSHTVCKACVGSLGIHIENDFFVRLTFRKGRHVDYKRVRLNIMHLVLMSCANRGFFDAVRKKRTIKLNKTHISI
jgi:hypothetical protein